MPLHTKTSAFIRECPACHSTDLEIDAREGETVCGQCGLVVEGNLIVQETQFEEAPSGSAHAVGQFVAHDPSADATSSEWRKLTMRKNQALLRSYVELLKYPPNISEGAFKLYKQLLHLKCTFGRSLKSTLAACIYVCCRKQQKPTMLYDISSQLRLDSGELLRAYYNVSKALKIYVDTVNPVHYIEKYVHLLNDVTSDDIDSCPGLTRLETTSAPSSNHSTVSSHRDVMRHAIRIVESMQEDGIDQGRRPGPVCAAAILAAAENLGYEVNLNKLCRIINSRPETVQKRLAEYRATPSAAVEQRDLLDIDLEDRELPPFVKYKKPLKRERQQLAALQQSNNGAIGLGTPTATNVRLNNSNEAPNDAGSHTTNTIGGNSSSSLANVSTKHRAALKNTAEVGRMLYAEYSDRVMKRKNTSSSTTDDAAAATVTTNARVYKRLCGRFAMQLYHNSAACGDAHSVTTNTNAAATTTNSSTGGGVQQTNAQFWSFHDNIAVLGGATAGGGFRQQHAENAAEDDYNYKTQAVQAAYTTAVQNLDLQQFKHSNEMRQLKTKMWLTKYDGFIKSKEQQMKRAAEEALEIARQTEATSGSDAQAALSDQPSNKRMRGRQPAAAAAVSADSAAAAASSTGGAGRSIVGDRGRLPQQQSGHEAVASGSRAVHQTRQSSMTVAENKQIRLSKTVDYNRMKQIFGDTLAHVEDLFS